MDKFGYKQIVDEDQYNLDAAEADVLEEKMKL